VLIMSLAEPLTEEEVARKEELSRHGFDNWSKRDFQQFVKAVEAHGRCDPYTFHNVLRFLSHCVCRDAPYEILAQEIQNKTAEDVKAYAKVFWKRWHELEGK
jgi:SWI/SNF-related matrix-associated actin-dependent regulator of chromatin subfamily A member 5